MNARPAQPYPISGVQSEILTFTDIEEAKKIDPTVKEEIAVSVTQQDIDSGQPGCEHRCPIAVAVKRELKALFVCVRPPRVYVQTGEFTLQTYDFPDEGEKFTNAFDWLKSVDPFQLKLRFRNLVEMSHDA